MRGRPIKRTLRDVWSNQHLRGTFVLRELRFPELVVQQDGYAGGRSADGLWKHGTRRRLTTSPDQPRAPEEIQER